MTVLVTGATGFLGNHVARLLAERGDRVRVLVRAKSKTSLLDGLAFAIFWTPGQSWQK